MGSASFLSDVVRWAAGEGLSNTLLGVVAAHQNAFGLLEPAGAGDRLGARPWREGEPLPVLFVHGYMGDRTNFIVLRRRLHLAGVRRQAAVWLWPFWRSCADYGRIVATRAREVVERTRAPAVDIVGHSMGGLAARAALRAGAPVRRVVTLGTPHRGSVFAFVGPGECARDLCPGSPFLCGLDGDLEALPPRTVLSIRGSLDKISPSKTALVPPPQENLRVEGLGHVGLMLSRRVARAVASALAAGEDGRQDAKAPRKAPRSILEPGSARAALAGT